MVRGVFSGLICFDLDDTLIHSFPAHLLAYHLAFRKRGLPPVSDTLILSRFGLAGSAMIQKIYPFLSPQKAKEIERDQEHFLLHRTLHHVKAVRGAVRAVTTLQKRGYVLAVVSNCRHRILLALLRAGGFDRTLFSLCVGYDDVAHPKPAPDEIMKAEHLVHLHADYMVGDTPYDILAAKKAKVKAIAVHSGVATLSALKKHRPYALLKSVAEVPAFVERDHHRSP